MYTRILLMLCAQQKCLVWILIEKKHFNFFPLTFYHIYIDFYDNFGCVVFSAIQEEDEGNPIISNPGTTDPVGAAGYGTMQTAAPDSTGKAGVSLFCNFLFFLFLKIEELREVGWQLIQRFKKLFNVVYEAVLCNVQLFRI